MKIQNKPISKDKQEKLRQDYIFNNCRDRMIAKAVRHGYDELYPSEILFSDVHHKLPRQFGGGNELDNLVLINSGIHKFFHTLISTQRNIGFDYIILPDLPQILFICFEQGKDLASDYHKIVNQYINERVK